MATTLRFRDETIIRTGVLGDNFHMTWTADDRLLAALCDGYGVPGSTTSWNTRLLVVSGEPPALTFEEAVGYPDLVAIAQYYGFGTFSTGSSIYVFLSTGERDLLAVPWSRVKLIYSHDNGGTWHNHDGSTPVRWESDDEKNPGNMLFFDEEQHVFSHLATLQMGRGYELNRDGYAYIYGTKGFVFKEVSPTHDLFLARVPIDRIPDRSRWEFYAGGTAGDPAWSADLDDRSAVCTAIQHWFPSVSYIPALGRYLMINGGDGPEGFDAPSRFGAWTAPDPWGPWTEIYFDMEWLPGGVSWARCYQARIMPKWIAEDGSHFWLVWSDYGTPLDAAELAATDEEWITLADPVVRRELMGRTRPDYRFNLQRVDIVDVPG